MIYTDRMAEAFKSRAGKKYQPSNGHEGDLFRNAFCNRCKREEQEDGEPCRILVETFAWDVDDEEYPEQWIIATDGQPTCTAFEKSLG